MGARGVALSRGRGSKHSTVGPPAGYTGSPSHGGADRNTPSTTMAARKPSRPLTGARIETGWRRRTSACTWVALSRGRGSKLGDGAQSDDAGRRPLTGARIETRVAGRSPSTSSSRPLTGARIETSRRSARSHARGVALSRGRGSKQRSRDSSCLGRWSPSHGGADRNNKAAPSLQPTTSSPSHGGADRNTIAAGSTAFAVVALSRGRGSKPGHVCRLRTTAI